LNFIIAKTSFKPDAALENIFTNVRKIYKIHENFYKELYEDRIVHWKDKPFIVDLFEKYLPELKIYNDYINLFESSFQSLINSIVKSKEFSQYLKSRNETVSVRKQKTKNSN
jgi:hypothetical protein